MFRRRGVRNDGGMNDFGRIAVTGPSTSGRRAREPTQRRRRPGRRARHPPLSFDPISNRSRTTFSFSRQNHCAAPGLTSRGDVAAARTVPVGSLPPDPVHERGELQPAVPPRLSRALPEVRRWRKQTATRLAARLAVTVTFSV